MSSKPSSSALQKIVCLLACGSVTLFLCFASLTSHTPSSLLRPYYWNARLRKTLGFSPALSTSNQYYNSSETLGIASSIYVVSLAHRTDRRQEMDVLATTMGLRWTYIDSVDAQDDKIIRIMDHVRNMRELEGTNESELMTEADFWWPNDIDTLSSSTKPLTPSGSDMWSLPPLAVTPSGSRGISGSPRGPDFLLTCSTNNATISLYDVDIPQYNILTPSKVACWYSHVSVIRLVANCLVSESEDAACGAAVVLEDDIDMERDIRQRLRDVWSLLPPDWDIVFLGHCWSDESYYPALQVRTPDVVSSFNATDDAVINTLLPQMFSKTSLHPSYAPKCTHAYVISRRGARRILLHLRHPPFAYSRAIDQALMWLVKSGRLKSYSVVPSVVVQRKVGESDILNGAGSEWKETLIRGVFDT